MQHPLTTALLALTLTACAAQDGDHQGSSESRTSEPEPDPGDGSSSSSSDESSSSTSSSSSGSSGEPVDPDPQPGAGHLWGRCQETTMLSCPAMNCMVYDQWGGEGFCTPTCNTTAGCNGPGEPLKSGATLVCERIYPGSLKYCLLACTEDSECLSGMQCKQLPNADPESPVQTVCA